MTSSIGIVGLPNIGKSTLFKALTYKDVPISNFPFCTTSPNIGIVNIPDERLDKLHNLLNIEKKTYATLQVIDIAGLVKNAHKGEGLGNEFLSHIREIDLIIHILRFFKDSNISHVEGEISPERDARIVNLELILSDLQLLSRKEEKLKKQLRLKLKGIEEEYELINKLKSALNNEIPIREVKLEEKEKEMIKPLGLLTSKPMIYVANISEEDINNDEILCGFKNIIPICCKLEAELAELPYEERLSFMKEIGLKENALNRLTKLSYKLLDYITFYTFVGGKELRAWGIKNGTEAIAAASKIHSDIAKGFIKAEIISYDEFIKVGSLSEAKEKGLIRIEGKDYKILDGDIVHFRFR